MLRSFMKRKISSMGWFNWHKWLSCWVSL